VSATTTSSRATDRRATAAAVRADQRARIDVVTDPAFLDVHLRPRLAPPVPAGPWGHRVVQLDGTGAATLEVSLAGRPVAFAKLFPDGSGAAVTRTLQVLRENGFGEGSTHQVVEPLAHVPEVGLLLAAVAPGTCVSDAVGVDPAALLTGCAHAGSWLAQLHSSPVRLGRPLPLLVTTELIPLAHRLAKAATRRPDDLGTPLRLLEVLDALTRDAVEGRSVQCHGQYRPIHVFVDRAGSPAEAPARVTVIDLDRSAPGDPARDVAEFLHRLRTTTYSTTGSVAAAEEPSRAFLDAYRAEVDDEDDLANLRLHRARYLVHSYNSQLKSHDPDEGRRDFCLAELDALLAAPA
jgi:Phosphotransferase enzyme family